MNGKSMSCFGNLFHQTTTLTGENFFFPPDYSSLPSTTSAGLLPKRQNSFRKDSEHLPGWTEGKTGGKGKQEAKQDMSGAHPEEATYKLGQQETVQYLQHSSGIVWWSRPVISLAVTNVHWFSSCHYESPKESTFIFSANNHSLGRQGHSLVFFSEEKYISLTILYSMFLRPQPFWWPSTGLSAVSCLSCLFPVQN